MWKYVPSIILCLMLLCSAVQAIDTTASGDYTAGATWVGGVPPADTETATVKTGHTLTFDEDMSGWANGITLIIETGAIFQCETTAGTYYLMCNADIDGAGTFQAGTSGTALPSTVTFTVDFNAGSFHFDGSGGLQVLLYCTQPTNKYVKLTAQEGAATPATLDVDTDVTADIWNVGDDVCIADMNKGKDCEVTTITATAAGPDTVSVTTLVAQKEIGAYIVLITRNILVMNSEDYLYRNLDSTCYIRCENDCKTDDGIASSCIGTEFDGTYWESTNNSTIYFSACDECNISGILCGSNSSGASDGMSACDGTTLSGLAIGMETVVLNSYDITVSGEIRGCNIAIQAGYQPILTAAGIIDNCFRGPYVCTGGFFYGTITNGNVHLDLCSGFILSATMSGASTADLRNAFTGQCYNTTFGSATENSGYNDSRLGKSSYVESFDHDGVVNAFKAWCRGGIVTSQTASPPTGYTIYYEHACEDTTQTYPVYRQFETTVQPGTSVEVEGYIQIPNGEDLTGYAPALQIVDKFADPLVDSTATLLDEDEIPEPDGSDATWQLVSVIWANSGSAPRTVLVRMIAWHDGLAGDVDINEAWSIASYKDQINALYTNLSSFISVGAAINTPPKAANDGFVITTGTNEVNDEDSTHSLDGTHHSIDSTGNQLDVYYEFSIGGDGIPVSTTLTGYLNGNNDDLEVHAYNWVTTSWDQIGELNGKALSTDDVHSYDLFTGHVGTGSDIGTVRIRFTDGAFTLTSATLAIDQIFVSYSIANRTVGYADGAIWVDTGGSNTNTESYVDGTADNPVSTWAAALTLSGNLNIERFHIIGGSSITLTGNSDNYAFLGAEWTLALGGQSIASAYIEGATVSGTSAGSNARFIDCKIGTVSLTTCGFGRCAITSDITLLSAGTYLFEGCFSGVAGTATPSMDFGAAVGNTNVNWRHYSGGIEIKNMGQSGTDNMSLEGHGQLVINANCTGGTVAIRGHFTVTDNASGAVTLSNEAMFDHNSIIDAIKAMTDLIAIVDTTVSDANDANSFTITDGNDTNDAYFEHIIMVEDSDGGHSELRFIKEWNATRVVLVEQPFSFTPAIGDKVWIMGTGYAGWMYEIWNKLWRMQTPVYYFDAPAGSSGATGGAGGTSYFGADGTDP